MKTVSIMEAQHNLSKVLKTIQRGGGVAITRHKKIVAEIRSPQPERPPVFPDFADRARNTWGGTWTGAGTGELLDEGRGDR